MLERETFRRGKWHFIGISRKSAELRLVKKHNADFAYLYEFYFIWTAGFYAFETRPHVKWTKTLVGNIGQEIICGKCGTVAYKLIRLRT